MADNFELPACPNCNDEGCEFCGPLPAEAACEAPAFEDVFGDEPAECPVCGLELVVGEDGDEYCTQCGWDYDGIEDDGQPTEYEEWQDYMGGDDWDHGQYDDYDT